MAHMYYEITGGWIDQPSTNFIYYNASYDPLKNQTTVTFDPTWHKIWRNNEVPTQVSTIITITPVDNETEAKQASTSFTTDKSSINYQREFYNPTPFPAQLTVQHSSVAGTKEIIITATTTTSAGVYSQGGTGTEIITVGEYSYGPVGEPVIVNKTDSGDYYRDFTLGFTWNEASDGNNNPVVGYKLYYGLSEGNYSQSIILNKVTSYSFRIMDNFGGPKKGTIFYLGIQALAQYGELHSSIVKLGRFSIINKPPEKPSFTTSNIIKSGGNTNITIAFTSGSIVDIDNDAVTYQYSVSANKNTPTDWKELPLNKTVSMNKSASYLHIRAIEAESGVAGSSNFLQVPINEKPTFGFSIGGANFTTVSNYKFADSLLNVVCNLTYKISSVKVSSYKWEFGSGNIYDIKSSNNTNKISTQKISSSQSQGEKKIQIKLTITDTVGDTFTEIYETDYYRLHKITPTSISISPSTPISGVSDTYITNSINAKVKIALPQFDVPRTIKFYRGQLNNSTGNWEYTDLGVSYSAEDGEISYGAFSTSTQRDIDYKFRAEIVDPFGNSTFIDTSGTYKRLGLFNIETFDFSKTEWHPLKEYIDNSEPEVRFTSTYSDAEGSIGKNYYTIQATYEGKTYSVMTKLQESQIKDGWRTEVEGNNIYFYIKNLDLFKKLVRATNTPTISVVYKITGYNAFGEAGATKTLSGTIITQETPLLNEISISSSINSGAKSNYVTWFNPGDNVTLNLSGEPKDYNDIFIDANGVLSNIKTIQNYKIYYKYSPSEVWREPQANWIGWQDTFVENNVYKKAITLSSMPSLALNNDKTNILLGLQFIDDKGNKSDFLSLELVACRMSDNIVANITQASFDKNNKKLKATIDITDCGGNNKGIENFMRNGNETFSINLLVSNDNQTFVSYIVKNKVNNSNLTSNLSLEITVSEEYQGKIYVKAQIVIITNYETSKQIETIISPFLLYLEAPTVSYRANQIGVNNSALTSEEIIHISAFGDRKKIKLTGFRDNTETSIVIDLSSGKIENVVLDCGSW